MVDNKDYNRECSEMNLEFPDIFNKGEFILHWDLKSATEQYINEWTESVPLPV